MDAEFWHERWDKNEIGFHEGAPNTLLASLFTAHFPGSGKRVFLPLCGKTRDIGWLVEQGYRVVGAELSRTAVDQLFEDLGVTPEISDQGPGAWYRSPSVEIYVGDIFELTGADLGSVDAIYDRAALVALPDGTRERYAEHMVAITNRAPQFLICFEYDQSVMPGPPFSISAQAVKAYYDGDYAISQIESREVPGKLKGTADAMETAWLLR